jgi:hypothetical protein
MVEKEQCYVENVNGVDEDTPSTSYVHMLFAPSHMLATSIHTSSSFFLDVENVHLQALNMSKDDIS